MTKRLELWRPLFTVAAWPDLTDLPPILLTMGWLTVCVSWQEGVVVPFRLINAPEGSEC